MTFLDMVSLEAAIASGIGVLVFAGVYLVLRARSFDVILGLTLLSYATNLLIFSSGRLVVGKPPVLQPGMEATLANHTSGSRNESDCDDVDPTRTAKPTTNATTAAIAMRCVQTPTLRARIIRPTPRPVPP